MVDEKHNNTVYHLHTDNNLHKGLFSGSAPAILFYTQLSFCLTLSREWYPYYLIASDWLSLGNSRNSR